MMAKTVSGVIVPVMTPPQLPQYEMRANAQMYDLHKSIADPSSLDALAKQGVEDIKKAQQIAISAAHKAKPGPPPNGFHIDVWA